MWAIRLRSVVYGFEHLVSRRLALQQRREQRCLPGYSLTPILYIAVSSVHLQRRPEFTICLAFETHTHTHSHDKTGIHLRQHGRIITHVTGLTTSRRTYDNIIHRVLKEYAQLGFILLQRDGSLGPF